jgi:hypothetical protein
VVCHWGACAYISQPEFRMIRTSLSEGELNKQLAQLEEAIETRPISDESLRLRAAQLSGSTPAQVDALLRGLQAGAYDNPSGWLQALRHLQATKHIDYKKSIPASKSDRSLDRKPRLLDSLFRIGLCLPLLALFLWTTSPAFKSCLLFLASMFFFMGSLVLLAFVSPTLAEANVKRLAGAIAFLISSVFYLASGTAPAFLAFAWLMLGFGVLGFVASAQRLVADSLFFGVVTKRFKERAHLDFVLPIVYVVGEPGWGEYFSHRLAAKLAHCLARYQFRPQDMMRTINRDSTPPTALSARLRRLRGGGTLAYFIISDTVRRFGEEFQTWMFDSCSALILVRRPLEISNEETYREFKRVAMQGLLRTPGPTFDLRVSPLVFGHELGTSSDFLSSAADVAQTVQGSGAGNLGTAIAPLVQRLSSSIIPMHWADSRLPVSLRRMAEGWSKNALSPVADLYLRLRLAQSDVERFLISLEGIELLIKISAIGLLTTS